MANLIRISEFKPEYSENIFENTANFENEPSVNVTSGTMSHSYESDITFDGGKSIYLTPTSYNSTNIAFNFGTALQTNIVNQGNYFLSFRILNANTTNIAFVPFVMYVKVWEDGINTQTFQFTSSSDELNDSKKWITWGQGLELTGTLIDFTFEIDADVTYPFSNITFYLDALKLELDDRFLGVPSIYSKPYKSIAKTYQNIIFVESLADLPASLSGVRNLSSNKTYFIADNIDLLGDRLVGGANTTILGASSEVSILTSTGLGSGIPLLTSIYSTPIRNIAIIDVDTAVSFDGTTNPNDMALDWTGVNFVNVPNIGTIKGASNFVYDKGAFLNSKGMKFDGTIGTIALNNSLFSGDGLSGNILDVLSTCTIIRRFRVIYSSIIATSSTIGINVNSSATIPSESYILDTINFSGGGTYLSGVAVTDNKTLFVNCKGISNTAEISQYYMNGNATTTTISATNTPVKVSGTTTSASITQKFTNTNNRGTYNGSFTRYFKVTATLSLESGTNNQIGCYIAKNGSVLGDSEVYGTTSGTGRAENIVVQTLVELSENDYIEIFVENASAVSNVLVTDLNTIII